MAEEAVQHKVVEKKVSPYRSTQKEMVNKKNQNKQTKSLLTNCLCRLDQVFPLREKVAEVALRNHVSVWAREGHRERLKKQ